MKTPYLLGIITVLLFGSFAMSGMMAQAGMGGLVVSSVTAVPPSTANSPTGTTSTATCPPGTQLIGGTYNIDVRPAGSDAFRYNLDSTFVFGLNEHRVSVQVTPVNSGDEVIFSAKANCGVLTFPMGMSMIGGELLDIDTMSLFIGAIGVNPVITGLVAITMGGVAAQAIWYVNSRRVKKVE